LNIRRIFFTIRQFIGAKAGIRGYEDRQQDCRFSQNLFYAFTGIHRSFDFFYNVIKVLLKEP
jgi:hypothetical protein